MMTQRLLNDIFRNDLGLNYVKNNQHFSYRPNDNNELEIAYSVLGFGKDDVSVEVLENKLKIKAKKSEEDSILNNIVSDIDETILIHKDYDLEKANCKVVNGVLSVSIPKKKESLAKKLKINL